MTAPGDLSYSLQRWLSDSDADSPITILQAQVADIYPDVPDMFGVGVGQPPQNTAQPGEPEADGVPVSSTATMDMDGDVVMTPSTGDSEAGGVAIPPTTELEVVEDRSVASGSGWETVSRSSGHGDGEESIVTDSSDDADVDIAPAGQPAWPRILGNEVAIYDVVGAECPPQAQEFIGRVPRVLEGDEDPELPPNDRLATLVEKYIKYKVWSFCDADGSNPVVGATGVSKIYLIGITNEIHRALGRPVESWNRDTHSQVLRDVIPPFLEDFGVGMSECDAARILPRYATAQTQGTTANFALYINPERIADPEQFQIATEFLRRDSPGLCLNHTDFAPIGDRPIAVGFTTVATEGEPPEEEIAEGVDRLAQWSAGQWKFLVDMSSTAAANELCFIPGIIIHGREWNLAITSFEDGMTKLWCCHPCGSTRTMSGVTRIYQTLLRLVTWSKQVYWPWYNRNVLNVGPSPTTAEDVMHAQGGQG